MKNAAEVKADASSNRDGMMDGKRNSAGVKLNFYRARAAGLEIARASVPFRRPRAAANPPAASRWRRCIKLARDFNAQSVPKALACI